MIHNSEIDHDPAARADQVVKVGDNVEFIVLSTDTDERRFSLSRKAALQGLEGEQLRQYIDSVSEPATAFADAFSAANERKK